MSHLVIDQKLMSAVIEGLTCRSCFCATAPGWSPVEKHVKVMTKFDEAESACTIPAGIIGKPSDVNRVAIFLASDEAGYLTGQALILDGGQSAILPLTGDFRQAQWERWGRGCVPSI